jgi:hypothetical protein
MEGSLHAFQPFHDAIDDFISIGSAGLAWRAEDDALRAVSGDLVESSEGCQMTDCGWFELDEQRVMDRRDVDES